MSASSIRDHHINNVIVPYAKKVAKDFNLDFEEVKDSMMVVYNTNTPAKPKSAPTATHAPTAAAAAVKVEATSAPSKAAPAPVKAAPAPVKAAPAPVKATPAPTKVVKNEAESDDEEEEAEATQVSAPVKQKAQKAPKAPRAAKKPALGTCQGVCGNGKNCDKAGKEEHEGKPYCGVHIKQVSKATSNANAPSKPEKPEKAGLLKTIQEGPEVIDKILKKKFEVKLNAYGKYVHTETNIVFDKNSQKAMGNMLSGGTVGPLTDYQLSYCETENWLVDPSAIAAPLSKPKDKPTSTDDTESVEADVHEDDGGEGAAAVNGSEEDINVDDIDVGDLDL
jgi:hypothetical protein